MTATKFFNIFSPFTIVTLMGVWAVLYGIIHPAPENNELQFIIGVPIILLSLLFHWLALRFCNYKPLTVWIVEGIIAIVGFYLFFYKF